MTVAAVEVLRSARVEWCVAWRREGLRLKRRRFRSRESAERFLGFLGAEPWLARGLDPDSLACCSGRECGCGGMTVREADLCYSSEMPPLLTVRIETREVTSWALSREVSVAGGFVEEAPL